MGWTEVRINGGPHSAILQLSPHFRIVGPNGEKVSGIIPFYRIENPGRDKVIFLETVKEFLDKSRNATQTQRLKSYRNISPFLLEGIQSLFTSQKFLVRQGLRLSPLGQYIVERKPAIILPDMSEYE